MRRVTIIKQDISGKEIWRYDGSIIKSDRNKIILEAFFDHQEISFLGISLKKGDRFKETFFNDRWYNIFEIYTRESGDLKGWYCNITKPAVFLDDRITYVDLALDLWVAPDGRQEVLDEEEFLELEVDEHTRKMALKALTALQEIFTNKFYV